jgi:hypothetical protein
VQVGGAGLTWPTTDLLRVLLAYIAPSVQDQRVREACDEGAPIPAGEGPVPGHGNP